VLPGSAHQLAAVRLGLVDNAGDLWIVEIEHLSEQEHRALGRTECLQQDEERHRQRVGQLNPFELRSAARFDQWFGQPRPEVRFTPHPRRP
jgi:hypothetical protein